MKFANDTFGHEQGDRLLIAFASVLKACLRTGEIIARWGGDEFVVLLPKTTNDIALSICERINSLSKNTVVRPLNLSVAIGTSTKTVSEQLFKDVISNAENLMYLIMKPKNMKHTRWK